MTQTWRDNPSLKVEVDGTELTQDSVSVAVHLLENAVNRCRICANDYRGKNFIGNLDVFDTLKVSFRYGSDAWTQKFEGAVEEVGPTLNNQGQTVQALAYGVGRCLRNTHCNTSYGVTSLNPTLDTPEDIWLNLRDNYVQKSFGGANTGYTLGLSYNACTSPIIQFLGGNLLSNLDILNETLLLISASQAGAASHHWIVDDENATLLIKAINSSRGIWAEWWRTNEAGSTLTEKEDLITYAFTKRIKDFANKIVLCTDLRKPPYDHWTEFRGAGTDSGSHLWSTDTQGVGVNAQLIDDNGAGNFVVGAYSLLFEGQNGGQVWAYYPGHSLLTGDAAAAQPDVTVASIADFKVGDNVRIWDNTPTTETAIIESIAGTTLTMTLNLTNAYQVADAAHVRRLAKWDFTRCQSPNSPPRLNFYFKKDTLITEANCWVRLFKTDHKTDYYHCTFGNWTEPDNEWIHRSLPIGDYWKTSDESRRFRWTTDSDPGWSEINGICFTFFNDAGAAWTSLWIDDLHFSGKLIREAYNSTSIVAYDEKQKIIRMDTAVDDTLKASDDSGTAARVAYAELLTAQTTPIVGTIVTPGAIDALPGQKVHVDADLQSNGVYRVAKVFRAKEVVHNFTTNGFTTTWDLTDDLTNSFAVGYANLLSALSRVIYVDPEAKNLKASGLDTMIPHLAKDYP